jgi:hypothetical protein
MFQTSLVDTPEREKVSSERSGYETSRQLAWKPRLGAIKLSRGGIVDDDADE